MLLPCTYFINVCTDKNDKRILNFYQNSFFYYKAIKLQLNLLVGIIRVTLNWFSNPLKNWLSVANFSEKQVKGVNLNLTLMKKNT